MGILFAALLVALAPQLAFAGPHVTLSPCHPVTLSPRAHPVLLAQTQPLTTTSEADVGLFVCRVDVAGAAGGATNVRALTAWGLALLVASRWLHFAGYALAFGVCAFLVLAARPLAQQPAASRPLWRLMSVGLALLVLAEPLALLAQTASQADLALFDGAAALEVLGSGYGLVLAQRLGAALLLWVLLGAARDGAAAAALPLGAALGAALALLNGTANPAAGAGNLWLGVALSAVDQAALGLLVGGGVALGLLWRLGASDDMLSTLRARLRGAVIVCLGALAASALASAALRLPAPTALFTTPYGLTLIAKLAALLVAVLAARAALRRGNASLWRSAGAAAGGALALAGLLASLP